MGLILFVLLASLQADTIAPSAEWILSTTTPGRQEAFLAWIHLSTGTAESVQAEIELQTTGGIEAWFASAEGSCERPASPPEAWSGSVSANTVLPACLRVSSDGPRRAVAMARLDPNGARGGQLAVASDPIEVRPRFPLGPTGMALFTALVGFLLGILSPLVTQFFEERRTERRQLGEIQKSIAVNLVPELTANRRKLRDFLDDGGDPPLVVKAQYEWLQGSKGALAYLDSEGRRAYLEKVEGAYGRMDDYDLARSVPAPDPDKVKNRARQALEAIDDLFAELSP